MGTMATGIIDRSRPGQIGESILAAGDRTGNVDMVAADP